MTEKPFKVTPEDVSTPAKVSEQLNKLGSILAEVLNHGLTLRENLRVQEVKGLRVVTGAAVLDSFPLEPIVLASHMPDLPTWVHIEKVRNLTDPREVRNTPAVAQWQPVNPRKVRIDFVTGLSTTTDYLLDVLILA